MESEDGTSFASPIVAGAAAWVWTVRPELDASQLFEVMRRWPRTSPRRGVTTRAATGCSASPQRSPTPRRSGTRRAERRHRLRQAGWDVLQRHSGPDLASEALGDRLGTDHRLRGPTRPVPRVRPEERAPHRRDERRRHDRPHAVGPHDRDGHRGEPRQEWARPGQDAGLDETLTYVNAGAATTAYLAVSLAKRTRDATYRITVSAR